MTHISKLLVLAWGISVHSLLQHGHHHHSVVFAIGLLLFFLLLEGVFVAYFARGSLVVRVDLLGVLNILLLFEVVVDQLGLLNLLHLRVVRRWWRVIGLPHGHGWWGERCWH